MEETTEDVLFVGATRPAMFWGVTLEVFLINGILSSIFFLATGNPLMILVCVPFHLIAYLACLNEPRRFQLLNLKLKCIMGSQNRGFWGCSSYSPFEKEDS